MFINVFNLTECICLAYEVEDNHFSIWNLTSQFEIRLKTKYGYELYTKGIIIMMAGNFYYSIEIARFCGYLSINHVKYDDKQTKKYKVLFGALNIKSAHFIRFARGLFLN